MVNKSLNDILDEIRNCPGLYAKCQLYGILVKREGINYEINGTTSILLVFFLTHVNFNFSFSKKLYYFSSRLFDGIISTSWVFKILDGRTLLQQSIEPYC